MRTSQHTRSPHRLWWAATRTAIPPTRNSADRTRRLLASRACNSTRGARQMSCGIADAYCVPHRSMFASGEALERFRADGQ